MIRREISELILAGVFLAAALAVFSYGKHATPLAAGAEHSCCHAKLEAAANPQANILSVATKAQDSGQEEGNPSHTRPKYSCNHQPSGNQVQCHCVTDCGGDGSPREDRRCKSFCYKDMCLCPRKPCA